MEAKIAALWPEIALFIGTCVVLAAGLSRSNAMRSLCAPICVLTLVVAGVLAWATTPSLASPFPEIATYGKVLVSIVGAMLALLMSGAPDREYETAVRSGRAAFDPYRSHKGEFYSFFLFSLMGLMLCFTANDLIWLFLALELTSLPTYIMVAVSTSRNRSLEAGVKYFFLGALGAAIFLYGFACIYGATGATNFGEIAAALAAQSAAGGLSGIAVLGFILAIIGMGFKIAAVPMHFYTPDVYQGAAPSVSAFLAFVPKTAGFVAIVLLVSTVGWTHGADGASLPVSIETLLVVMAALTMTVGNVLALVQSSIKRVLAYSSIAHSGYMLVGVVAGPGTSLATNGIAAVLFYLLSYGVMNLGAFAVLACLERRGRSGAPMEVETLADVRGLCRTSPALGWTLVLSMLGLLGLPPLLGFWGKLWLFSAGVSSGYTALVVLLAVNSAVAAWYYLMIARAALLEEPEDLPNLPPVVESPFRSRRLAGLLSAGGVAVLWLFAGQLADQAASAARFDEGFGARAERGDDVVEEPARISDAR